MAGVSLKCGDCETLLKFFAPPVANYAAPKSPVKPISLEASKDQSSDDVDMVDASITGEPEEMVVPDVDSKLLEELESMGFSKESATWALYFSGEWDEAFDSSLVLTD
ncbi:hypothetical protein L1887_34384 [Cichorium endivia]|nr:hypothetical protein L1887_34384 [Cichorium endivia]